MNMLFVWSHSFWIYDFFLLSLSVWVGTSLRSCIPHLYLCFFIRISIRLLSTIIVTYNLDVVVYILHFHSSQFHILQRMSKYVVAATTTTTIINNTWMNVWMNDIQKKNEGKRKAESFPKLHKNKLFIHDSMTVLTVVFGESQTFHSHSFAL